MKIHILSYIAFVIVPYCLADSYVDKQWKDWKNKYGKEYRTLEEEANRRAVWERNLDFVQNRNNNDLHSGFRVEMNAFADQVPQTRPKLDLPRNPEQEEEDIEHNLTVLPSYFDWRTKGAISGVKNQGMLGSAAPIVADECMMSYNYIKTGKMVELSLQEIVDCCTHGSGFMSPVYDCIHKLGGLCSEADYPTTGQAGTCKSKMCKPVIENKGTMIVPKGREDQLQIAVLQNPVEVAIDASHSSFQLYQSGIYDEPDCSETKIDHVVQVVGYGSQNGKDYWIVKNSWGVNWGMQGYILMSRNKNNQCGIASYASYPV